jgi:hypothetical protein
MITGVALTQVCRILHTGGFYPYHLQRVQYVLLEDHAPFVQRYECLEVCVDSLPDILFTDAAQFTCDVINSEQNIHSCVHENLH